MKVATKIAHHLIQKSGLDEISAFYSSRNSFIQKLCPQPSAYRIGTNKLVVRDAVHFLLDPSDYMQWHIYTSQPEHSHLLAFNAINSLPQHQPFNILDVGANVGGFTLRLAALLDQARLHSTITSFEPNPSIYRKLQFNIELNSLSCVSIETAPMAIGNCFKTVQLSIDTSNSGASRLSCVESSQERITCDQISVDDFVSNNLAKIIHFIKIDVEGFEPFVLEGARNTIANHRPFLYIEITPKWFAEHGYRTHAIFNNIVENGYQIHIDNNGMLLPIDLSKLHELPWQYNILCRPTNKA